MTTVVRLAAASTLCAVCLSACSSPSSLSRLRVVAGESPWGAVAAAIGGNKVDVLSLVANPSVDPHSFTATAADAAAVNQASVVIENGLGYDNFVDQVLATGTSGPRSVVTVSSVLGVKGPNANPHLWYWLDRVPTVAAAIERAMAERDPKDASAFQTNLENFDHNLAPLIAELAHIDKVAHGVPVAQTERVAGYLLAEAGLTLRSPLSYSLAIEAGTTPSFQAQRQMNNLMSSHAVRVLIYNVQTVTSLTTQLKQLAQSSGVPVVGVSEVVEPQSAGFIAWQQDQIVRLEAALGLVP